MSRDRTVRLLIAAVAIAGVLGVAGCGATGPSVTIARTHMNAARWWPTTTVLGDGRVLIAGGSALRSELFDPKSGNFELAANMMHSRSQAMAVLLADGRVLVAGGDELGTAELFDPKLETFVATGSMHETHWNGTATLLPDGRVLVAGGSREVNTHSSPTAELFDPATGRFTLTGSMNQARELQTATLIPGVGVLIAGGESTDGDRLSSAEKYDPTTGTFSLTGSLGEARSDHTATLLPNRQVLVVGGYAAKEDKRGIPVPSSAEIFDPSTGWFRSFSWPWGDGTEAATAMLDGRVLIIGSVDSYLYDSNGDAFTVLGGGGVGPDTKIVALLADGRVFVIGGTTTDQDAPSTKQVSVLTLKG